MKLRNYQTKAVDKLSQALDNNINSLLIAFMGSGKSVMLAKTVENFFRSNKGAMSKQQTVLVIVHRKNLVDQLKKTFKKLINRTFYGNIIFLTRQTCSNNTGQYINKLKPELIVVDEAHQISNNSYKKILKNHNGLTLGCTATPIRSDQKHITDILEPIHKITHKDLTNEGYSVPLKIYKAGNTQQKNLGNTLKVNNKLPEFKVVLQELLGLELLNKKTIIFCSTNDVAESMANFFNDNFILCENIKGSHTEKEREVILKNFRQGNTQILINSLLLTEGFDCPEIEVVVLYKNKCHKSTLWQMIGRGTRLAENKKYCTVIDFGNTDQKTFNADFLCEIETKGSGTTPTKECSHCLHENLLTAEECVSCKKPFTKTCSKCGTHNRILSRRCFNCGKFFSIGNTKIKIKSISGCFFSTEYFNTRSLYNKKTGESCLILVSKTTGNTIVIVNQKNDLQDIPGELLEQTHKFIQKDENKRTEEIEKIINPLGLSVYDVIWFGKPSFRQKSLIVYHEIDVKNINNNFEVSNRLSLFKNKEKILELIPGLPSDFYNH